MSSLSIQAALTITSDNLVTSILEKIELIEEFTTVIDVPSRTIESFALSLISLDPYSADGTIHVTHIGILKKGRRIATGMIGIKAFDIIQLPRTPLNKITSRLPANLRSITAGYFSNRYSRIPDKTGEILLNVILNIFPQYADAIEKLAWKLNRQPVLNSARNEDAAVEKDALGLCLDIFGADRSKILQSWNDPSDSDPSKALNKPQDHSDHISFGNSFLSGLTKYAAYEDDIINHDLKTLPGWKTVSSNITGMVEFKNKENEKLVIINANRKPLEKALGVDLIYFHRKYEAFTFVQYKMMDQKSEDDKKSYYNPQQGSHTEEHARMQSLYEQLLKEQGSEKLIDYRVGNCPFFFKVCKKIQLKYDDTSIALGAYIPLNQWNILLKDESTKGPKGGCQIGFHTLGNRYLGTQVFVDLMQRGFLGTQSAASKKIGLFIEDSIAKGKSVMYAIDERDLSDYLPVKTYL